MEPERNRTLAEIAVRDTGLGNVADKIVKNHRKTLGLLRDLKGARSTGVIAEYPDRGIVEIAKPAGVVAARHRCAPRPVRSRRPGSRAPAAMRSRRVRAAARRDTREAGENAVS
jgi:hypothetical protein